jgi:ribosomal protein S27AE
MAVYTEEFCPKCGNVTIKVIFTTDVDYVQCDSCHFATELCSWSKISSGL